MVELSQLLGLFTGKLMAQQDQVGEIHEAAASANVNVEQVDGALRVRSMPLLSSHPCRALPCHAISPVSIVHIPSHT